MTAATDGIEGESAQIIRFDARLSRTGLARQQPHALARLPVRFKAR
jgi:hypothetical protein